MAVYFKKIACSISLPWLHFRITWIILKGLFPRLYLQLHQTELSGDGPWALVVHKLLMSQIEQCWSQSRFAGLSYTL